MASATAESVASAPAAMSACTTMAVASGVLVSPKPQPPSSSWPARRVSSAAAGGSAPAATRAMTMSAWPKSSAAWRPVAGSKADSTATTRSVPPIARGSRPRAMAASAPFAASAPSSSGASAARKSAGVFPAALTRPAGSTPVARRA